MTAEQREAYLAQRREYYHSRRARLTNNRRTANHSTRAQLQTDLGPQFPTSPAARGRLARSIPVPINLNSSSTHLPQTSNPISSSSTATSTGTHVNSITRVSSGRLSRSIPMPTYVNSIPNNQAEASTSTPTFTQPAHAETAATITRVTRFSGRSHLTPLPHNPFTFNTHLSHHFETSTSRGQTSTREGHDVDVHRDEFDIHMSDAEDVNSESTNDDDRTTRTNLHHNRARDFREEHGFPPYKLPNPTTCHLCCARLFHGENKKFCCKGGRVVLPEIPVPIELLRIFTDTSAEGRIFRQNIRAYNHVFSFTSIGVQLNRALITPLNEDVNKLNEKVIEIFPGDEVTYYSFDSVGYDMRNLYLPEFLNSLSPGNLPPHKLTLKTICPIMLLRNIDPKIGLCNGTRLICHRFGRNVIDAEILSGQFKGTRVFLPRIPLKTSEDAKLPFEFTRKQFPVRLSFALTINKSQGQTIPHVGIYLPDHVFSHGPLYVALSRGVSETTTKVLVKKGRIDGHEGVYTRNVVYPEIFAKLRNHR